MDARSQERAWDAEYRARQLLSPSNVPHAEVVRFFRWLKKEYRKAHAEPDAEPFSLEGKRALDLGSGTGRNSVYLAEQGAQVTGYEFSPTALAMAKKAAEGSGLPLDYHLRSIGEPFPLPDGSMDIVLDVTSSNSLSDAERTVCLAEISRVLAPGGTLFLRALSLEGDAHAKELVKRVPGPDPDTYIHPDLGIVEKVFSRESLARAYEPRFAFLKLDRVQHYAKVAGRTYKRSYWVAYLQRRGN